MKGSCLVRTLLSSLSIGSFAFPMLSCQGGVSSTAVKFKSRPWHSGTASGWIPNYYDSRSAKFWEPQKRNHKLREPSAPKHRSPSIPYG